MINQIYHTSHCGSTLLASLLSTIIPSYSEPSWCHQLVRGEDINFHQQIEKYENSLIKLPSTLCHFAHEMEDKKIFLYRNLKNHLFKLLTLDKNKHNYLNYYEYYLKNIHPNLEGIEFDTDEKKHVFLWANKVFWLLDSQNVFGVESNKFFLNKKEILNEICNFLELERIKNFSYENYNVKSIGLNCNDIELGKVQPDMENKRITYPSFGVIEDAVCLCDDKIMEVVGWAKDNIDIPEFLI
jgi:hypothetical protein